jgi:choline monooxygenase
MRNMPASHYTGADVFVREQQGLFRQHWQLLCHASQLQNPGDYVSADIAGQAVFAIIGDDHTPRAFLNVCRHRGAQLLAPGTGNCNTLRCPYHNWLYQTNGELKHAPWFGEDPSFNTADWPLEPISITLWRNLVFVAIAPTLAFEQQLGACDDELKDVPIETYRLVATRELEFDANWKTYTDNFVEGYHIPGIHPEFFRAIDFNKFSTVALDGMVRMTAPPRGDLFYQGKWLWMWPNWTLSLFDGGMNTSRINPLSANRTQLIYRFYFADTSEERATERQATIDANIAVIEEDFGICLSTQANYEARVYDSGPLSPRHEQGVAYFQQRYLDSMNPTATAD